LRHGAVRKQIPKWGTGSLVLDGLGLESGLHFVEVRGDALADYFDRVFAGLLDQLAFQGAQAVFRRQVELVREAFDKFGAVSKDFVAPGSAEEKLAKQAELSKAAFESALANAREIGELVQKTSEDAIEVISKRVAANFDEVKAALKTKAVKN
jgi:phasin family protein